MAEQPSIAGKPHISNADLDGLSDEDLCRFWNGEIDKSCAYFKDWWDTCDRIVERYRDERGRHHGVGHRTSEGGRIQTKRFNVLWSNVQTLFPALYTDPPPPVVSRRYKDDDPLARLSVEISERCLQFIEDPAEERCSFDAAARGAVLEYLLTGRGTTWARYEKEVEEITIPAVMGMGPDEAEVELEPARTEEETRNHVIYHDHVGYREFIHMVAPSWDKILEHGWAGRLHYMTKSQVRDDFGTEAAENVQLTATDTASSTGRVSRSGEERKGKQPMYAEVWEIWNVPDRKVYFVAKGSGKVLDPMKAMTQAAGYQGATLERREDPLGLRDFLPCPRPLFGTTTPDTLIPVPDYVQYYDQAENLDRITDKKWKLTTALRVAGFYAAKEGEKLQQVFDGTDRNVMIPVQDWASITADGGGVNNLITWVPLDLVVQALASLEQAEEDNKQQIYEITGIADIIRGQTKASETLGAQRIKGQWASVRISDRQRLTSRFCRGMLRIDAEIIAEHYDVKTIAEMTNFANSRFAEQYGPVFAEAVRLLRDDKMRSFRVDVETEDTVFADQNQERAQNIEMLSGMATFMQAAGESIAQAPETANVWGEMMMIGVKSFHGSQARRLEMAVEEMVARVQDKIEQAQNQPAPPDPEVIEQEREAQRDQMEAQDKAAGRQIEAQGQVLDFQTKARGQALEKRKQDLDFIGKNRDRLAQLLASAGNA